MPADSNTLTRSAHPLPTIKIGGVAVEHITYKGEPVATFAHVDRVHKRAEGTARRTFNKHRKRFVEGEDYVVVDQPDVLRTLGLGHAQGGTPAAVTLITQRGYGKLVKPLSDDRAWDVQGEMVAHYFAKGSAALVMPEFRAPTNLREALILALEQEERIAEKQALLDAQAPKVAAHDRLSDATGWKDMQETAKRLGTGRTRLFAWMRDTGILIAGDLPRQRFIEAGYFRVKTGTYDDGCGTIRDYTKVLVSGKGLNWLAKRFGANLQLDIDLDGEDAA